jgi:DNA repair ATPase RecN
VDVGISGPTAAVVGKLLRQLGESTQVMCVTHLPPRCRPAGEPAPADEHAYPAAAYGFRSSRHRSLCSFDEVDVGISGPTAAVVGKLLRQLGESTQVMCVTHQQASQLLQTSTLIQRLHMGFGHLAIGLFADKEMMVAAACDLRQVGHAHHLRGLAQLAHHFFVCKETDGEMTETHMQPLDKRARLQELARLPHHLRGLAQLAQQLADHGSGRATDADVHFVEDERRGQPLQPIAKVASGGELSRIALAIQVITARKMETPVTRNSI